MPILTSAMLLDALLSKGLDIGLDKLADLRPEQLAQTVHKLRAQEAATRRARMQDIVTDAAQRATAEYGSQTDEQGIPLTNMLDHAPFLARTAELLLLGERPDVAQLRAEFLPLVGPNKWAAGQRPLLRFLQELELILLQDETWGPVLRAFRLEASMANIDRTTLALGAAVVEMTQQLAELPAAAAKALVEGLHPLDLGTLEKHYLRAVYAECNDVPLAGDVPPDEARERRPRLHKIYVDLRTTTAPDLAQVFTRLGIAPAMHAETEITLWRALPALGEEWRAGSGRRTADAPSVELLRAQLDEADRRERDTLRQIEKTLGVPQDSFRPALDDLSVLEAIGQHRQLVILGDPGSGKSTLVRRLAGAMAAIAREDLPEGDRDWRAATQGACDRWLLPVRVVLSRWASHLADETSGCADDLLAECRRLLETIGRVDGPRQAEHFLARLTADPPTVLLLLDGLDEVADERPRKRLLKAVEHFIAAYPQVPLVVTCRQRPYHEGKHYRLSLPAVTLAPLPRPAIGDFLQRWHDELTWAGLYQPKDAATALQRLTAAIDDPDRDELRAMAGTPLLLTMMARVNYDRGLPDNRAALYEAYVKKLLWEWEHTKLDDQGQPTGLELLLKRAGVSDTSLERALNKLAYSVHGEGGQRSLVDIPQAAVRTAMEEIHGGDDAQKAAWAVEILKLIDDRSGLIYALEQNRLYRFSHLTFQEYLAARWLASGDSVRKFKEKVDRDLWQEAIFLALGYQVSVAGEYDNALEVIDELLPAAPTTSSDWRRVLLLGEAYTRLMGPQRAREAEREKLRTRVMAEVPARLTAAMQNPTLAARQRLPAGLLLDALGIEPPGLDELVAAPGWGFAMARYPVTNRQYRRFVAAGGYAAENEEKWWSKDGRRYKGEYRWTGPRYWDDHRLNDDSQPVVGISWYEANAYCAWLTDHLRAKGTLAADQAVRLPTQAEWMQAAQAGDDRAYPWGNDFDASRANTEENNLGQTTPVWMYPAGCTPEGIWDMAGNVWEWTADVDTDGRPWLKGGAWFWGKDRAISAARHLGGPGYWTSTSGCGWWWSPSLLTAWS